MNESINRVHMVYKERYTNVFSIINSLKKGLVIIMAFLEYFISDTYLIHMKSMNFMFELIKHAGSL